MKTLKQKADSMKEIITHHEKETEAFGRELAKMIARHWLTAAFEGGRHQRRIDMIAAIEEGTFNP